MTIFTWMNVFTWVVFSSDPKVDPWITVVLAVGPMSFGMKIGFSECLHLLRKVLWDVVMYTLKSAAGHVALYAPPAQHHDRPNVNWFSWHFQTEDWLHFVKWIFSAAAASMEAMLRFHVFFFDGFCWKKSHMSSVVTNVWLVFEEDLCSSKVKSRSGQVTDASFFVWTSKIT